MVMLLVGVSILLLSCASSPKRITKLDFEPELLRDVSGLPQGDDTYKLEKGVLYLAGRSKVTLILESYCLSSDRAAPDANEPYYFIHGAPTIPLYKEIMSFVAEHPEVKQSLVQNLLWNLANEVKFEDLSYAEQELLLKVDPDAYLKVNSFLKEMAKKQIRRLLEQYLPKEAEVVLTIVKGKYYTYNDYERQINSLRARVTESMPTNVVPQPVGETGLYAIVYARGYSRIKVVIYNPSNPRGLIMKIVDWFTKPWREAITQALGTAGNSALEGFGD